MHAMMEPEQILEHARAAEAAGAHRFCMVTQGQGLSKRDFEKVLEGARLVAEHTNLKRCASIGHMSADARPGAQGGRHPARPPQRRDRASPTTTRSPRRSATRAASARSRRSGGGARDLRRRDPQPRRDAASSASRWPSSWPRSTRPACRSTCSTRGRARSSATASYMDPWEAVKWVAIFRLDPPRRALPALRRARREPRPSCSRSRSRPGVNGVMMGNFLTTLGNEPAEDRAMFEDLGLNVARQPDNGANPRPDNRSGWLDGRDARRRRGVPRRPRPRHRGAPVGPVDAAPLRQEDPSRRGPTARRTAGPRRRSGRRPTA